jgi:hypothetical protein
MDETVGGAAHAPPGRPATAGAGDDANLCPACGPVGDRSSRYCRQHVAELFAAGRMLRAVSPARSVPARRAGGSRRALPSGA